MGHREEGRTAGDRGRLVGACHALLRLAARIVPGAERDVFLREWGAEVDHGVRRAGRSGAGSDSLGWLFLRCLGAFPHACWLRKESWRLDMLAHDLRGAIRSLGRRPGYAAVSVLTLALGIAAVATIYSAVEAVLLRPLPFPEPGRLVRVYSTSTRAPDGIGGTASPPDFVDWRSGATSLSGLAAFNPGSFALTGAGSAEQVPGAQVTGDFFPLLGVPPLIGRSLGATDCVVGASPVAVLGHGLWRRRFGADRGVLGRTVRLEGEDRRVVGVMPPGFAYPLQAEVWLPLRFTADDLATQRGAHYLSVVGRLAPGASLADARAQMRTIATRLAAAYPSHDRNSSVSVHPLRAALTAQVRPALLMLLGAACFVLLIVCANLAGLALSRTLGRGREIAVRAALGAGRARLVRGLLAESLVIAGIGGTVGLGLTALAGRAVAGTEPALQIPLLGATRIDQRVALLTVAVALLSGLLFGAAPAWLASTPNAVGRGLRAEGPTATGGPGHGRLRGGLIVVETALAVALLAAAGLLLRSFVGILGVDLGFATEGVQTFALSLPDARYAEPERRAAFARELVSKLAAQPDVTAAGTVFGLPLTGFRYVISLHSRDGVVLPSEEQDRLSVQVRVVTPEYFRAVGMRIVRGRGIEEKDRAGAPLSAVVSESAARLLWPGADPIGHSVRLGTRLGQPERAGGEVVGVVNDVRSDGPVEPVRPTIYLVQDQFPQDYLAVVVRTRGRPEQLLAPSRALVARLDPDLPMFRMRSMRQLADAAVARPRVYLALVAVFAGLSLLLAALGIYGVLSHAVGQRTREIGIRLALGAGRRRVTAQVVGGGARLAAAGVGLGLALALLAQRALASLLYGVSPTDPLTYVEVAAAGWLVGLAAAWLPARRAARIDPARALRRE